MLKAFFKSQSKFQSPQSSGIRQRLASRRGGVLVELAFTVPIMVSMCFLTAEFVLFIQAKQKTESLAHLAGNKARRSCGTKQDLEGNQALTECLNQVIREMQTVANDTIKDFTSGGSWIEINRYVDPSPDDNERDAAVLVSHGVNSGHIPMFEGGIMSESLFYRHVNEVDDVFLAEVYHRYRPAINVASLIPGLKLTMHSRRGEVVYGAAMY